MYIKMNIDEIQKTCAEMKATNQEMYEELTKIEQLILDTEASFEGNFANAFLSRFQEMRKSYERIFDFHDDFIKELNMLCKDYEELEETIAKRIECI